MPTTTPLQFDPDAWRQTLDRYLSFAPQRMFLTHYSQVQTAPELAQTLRQGIARYDRIATTRAAVPDRHAQLLRGLTSGAIAAVRTYGCTLPDAQVHVWLGVGLPLPAQGWGVWR